MQTIQNPQSNFSICCSKILCIMLLALFWVGNVRAQESINKLDNITPGGRFETVSDKDGNTYPISSLKIGSGNKLTQQIVCTSGYFNLYFEDGCGMELNNATHIDRRKVICQLFNDISNFITPVNSTTKINVWIRDKNQISVNPLFLGLASSYYYYPSNAINKGAVIDNVAWQTINSGTDAWTGIIPPFVTGITPPYLNGGSYYHMMITFNFANVTWNTNLANASSNTDFDLYTVALHEVTHALGFSSLMNCNRNSAITNGVNGTNYYSRYDLRLTTGASAIPANELLIKNTGSCSMYGYNPNTLITTEILNPNCTPANKVVPCGTSLGNLPTDFTNCATAINYQFLGGGLQQVYTPDCFEPGSSLSHFEDQCNNPGGALCNNCWFTMSNAMGTGVTKRYLKQTERDVLCELGYNLNTTFGNNININLNQFTYANGGCKLFPVGVSDGIVGNNYTYVCTNAGTVTIPGSAILGNDYNTSSFECLESVYNLGSTGSIVSGTAATNIVYTPNANAWGIDLLRYIPISSAGRRGNVTYIYVFINNTQCIPTVCSPYINNPGFELTPTAGNNCIPNFTSNDIYCWGLYNSTSPDLTGTSCTADINGCNPYLNPSDMVSPPLSSFLGNSLNKHFVHLYGKCINPTSLNTEETVQTLLKAPLIPGKNYILRANAAFIGNTAPQCNSNFFYFPSGGFYKAPNNAIGFALSGYSQTTLLPGILSSDFQPTTGGLVNLIPNSLFTVPQITPVGWVPISIPFTVPAGSNLNGIVIGLDLIPDAQTPINFVSYQVHAFIDDIEILDAGPQTTSLNLPSCATAISNMNNWVTNPIPGGVFTGSTGIVGNSFNPALDPSSVVTIIYTYKDVLGCSHSISGQMGNLQPLILSGGGTICSGGSITATSNLTNVNYIINGVAANVPLTFTATGTYTIVATSVISSCSVSATKTFIVGTPVPPITISCNTVCLTSTATLTVLPAGLGTYSFTPSINVVGPNNTSSNTAVIAAGGLYTVTVTNGSGCGAWTGMNVSGGNGCGNPNVVPITAAITTTTTPITNIPGYSISGNIDITGTVNIANIDISFLTTTASLTIKTGAVVSIKNTHLHGCSTMWKGIIVEPGAQLILATGNLIEDATTAVEINNPTSSNGLILDATNTTFNKNYVSIGINNYQFNNAPPFKIENCVFTCREIMCSVKPYPYYNSSIFFNTIPPANDLVTPYYSFDTWFTPTTLLNGTAQSFNHITLNNVGYTSGTILTPAYKPLLIQNNIFDMANTGITAVNTNLDAQFNVFQNILRTGQTFQGWGIVALKTSQNATSPLIEYQLNALNNQFYDCTKAIGSSVYLDNNIKDNNLRNNTSNTSAGLQGISITSAYNRVNNITNNQIFNIVNAISVVNSIGTATPNNKSLGKTNILKNVIANVPGTIINAAARVVQAIKCTNTGVVQSGFVNVHANPKLAINDNTITNVFNGIMVSGYQGISAHVVEEMNNTITLAFDRGASTVASNSNSPDYTGIYDINNLNVFCKNNTVTGPPLFATANSTTPPNNYNLTCTGFIGSGGNGVPLSPRIVNFQFSHQSASLNSSNFNIVACNISNGGCFGFEFDQLQPNIQWNPLNQMNGTHFYGMVLNAQATIAPQFAGTSTNNPIDCSWNFTPAGNRKHTFVFNSALPTPAVGGLRVKNTTLFNPSLNASLPLNTNYGIGGNIIVIQGGSTPNCESVIQKLPQATNIASLNAILNGSMAAPTYTTELTYVGNKNIYNTLKSEVESVGLSPTIQNFFTASNAPTHPFRKLYDMEEAVSNGNYIVARTLYNAFTATNDIENNYKRYVDINIKYYGNGALSPADKQDLVSLAMSCPHSKGSIVYSARAMFNAIFPENYTMFYDNCDGAGMYKTKPMAKAAIPFDVNIYPNPTDNTVYILTNLNQDEQIAIEVIDVTGKTVIKQNCTTNYNNCFINLLPNVHGLYILKITNSLNETIIKKVVLE
jgi:Secretion system C-terminal sorting domain